MPSLFPGMNPYFEQEDEWHNFYFNFIVRMQAALVKQARGRYIVRTVERLHIHELSAKERQSTIRLDFTPVDIEKQRCLEIRTADDKTPVTVVEFLHRTNKSISGNFDVYILKRDEALRSKTHFVEIDLLRGGRRPSIPGLPHCDYYVLVSRREDRPNVSVWPFNLRDPLPIIPIPLSEPDPDLALDLKAVLDETNDSLNLERWIYEDSPEPPLSPSDAEWARQFLPKRRRSK